MPEAAVVEPLVAPVIPPIAAPQAPFAETSAKKAHTPEQVAQEVNAFMDKYSGDSLKAMGVSDENLSKGFTEPLQNLILNAHIFNGEKNKSYYTHSENGTNALSLHMDFPKDVPVEQITAVRHEILGDENDRANKPGRVPQINAYMEKTAIAYNAKVDKWNEKIAEHNAAHPEAPRKPKTKFSDEQLAAIGKLSVVSSETTNENGTHLMFHFGIDKPSVTEEEKKTPARFGPSPFAAHPDIDANKFVGHAVTFGASTTPGKENSWTESFPLIAGPEQVSFLISSRVRELESVMPETAREALKADARALLKDEESVFRVYGGEHRARSRNAPSVAETAAPISVENKIQEIVAAGPKAVTPEQLAAMPAVNKDGPTM